MKIQRLLSCEGRWGNVSELVPGCGALWGLWREEEADDEADEKSQRPHSTSGPRRPGQAGSCRLLRSASFSLALIRQPSSASSSKTAQHTFLLLLLGRWLRVNRRRRITSKMIPGLPHTPVGLAGWPHIIGDTSRTANSTAERVASGSNTLSAGTSVSI